MFGMGERNSCSRSQGGACAYFDRCWGTTVLSTAQPLWSRLHCAWQANVLSPECRVREQIQCPRSSLKPEFKPFLTISAEGLTPGHFETPSSLRSTSHFPVFWKSICRSLWGRWRSKQWAFWMQWILEVWRKVAVGSVYGIFAAYLRARFIKDGFHMPFCSKSHPIVQTIF